MAIFYSSIALLCVLTLVGCAYARRSDADAHSFRAERNREASVLIAHATPSDLAAAALLLTPEDSNAQQQLDLIEWAQKRARQRPDFVWVHLAIRERFNCGARAQIAAHLQALDPDNGFAWASDLEGLPLSGSNAVTAVIARIGGARRMTIYWNQLEVMMVDALAVANPSQDLATRGIDAIGMLAAEPIPSLQAMTRACRLDQLGLPGRRAACGRLPHPELRARSSEFACLIQRGLTVQFRIMPIVISHLPISHGQFVIGRFVRRSPKACPPCAYKCISTETPASFSAM